jgi:hypothetical protein
MWQMYYFFFYRKNEEITKYKFHANSYIHVLGNKCLYRPQNSLFIFSYFFLLLFALWLYINTLSSAPVFARSVNNVFPASFVLPLG